MTYWEITINQGIENYYRCTCFMCTSQRLKAFNDVNTRALLKGLSVNLNSDDFDSKLYSMGVSKYEILGRIKL